MSNWVGRVPWPRPRPALAETAENQIGNFLGFGLKGKAFSERSFPDLSRGYVEKGTFPEGGAPLKKGVGAFFKGPSVFVVFFGRIYDLGVYI